MQLGTVSTGRRASLSKSESKFCTIASEFKEDPSVSECFFKAQIFTDAQTVSSVRDATIRTSTDRIYVSVPEICYPSKISILTFHSFTFESHVGDREHRRGRSRIIGLHLHRRTFSLPQKYQKAMRI